MNNDPNETYQETVFDSSWMLHRDTDYHKYRKDWTMRPATATPGDAPLHLDIETTTWCNLQCPHCPRTIMVNDGRMTGKEMIKVSEYVSILDQAADIGVKSIKLNYLGEPLLHEAVEWHVSAAKKVGIVDVLMNSNGAALTQKVSRKLLGAGLDGMFISMDATNPADWQDRRPGTTLGRVIDNVYTFAKLRDKIRPGCQLRVSMVLPAEDPTGKWHRQFEALKTMFEGVVDAVGFGEEVLHSESASGEYPNVPGFVCAQPFQRMMLKLNGHVTACCFDSADAMVMGNWRDTSLAEIWNGPAYTALRNDQVGDYYKVPLCRTCYLPACASRREKAA